MCLFPWHLNFKGNSFFYAPHFVCFHIPKKLQSSVLFLAAHPQPRAGIVSFRLSRKENADKNTCTGNLQTLISLPKIQQETAIVRTVLLSGDLIVPQASSNILCLSLSGFVRKQSHSKFLAALRKIARTLNPFTDHLHEEFIPAGTWAKAPCVHEWSFCHLKQWFPWVISGFHVSLFAVRKLLPQLQPKDNAQLWPGWAACLLRATSLRSFVKCFRIQYVQWADGPPAEFTRPETAHSVCMLTAFFTQSVLCWKNP